MGSFIIEDIELRFESFCFEIREDVIKGFDNGGGLSVGDGSDNDGISGVIVGNEDVLVVLEGHCGKTTC